MKETENFVLKRNYSFLMLQRYKISLISPNFFKRKLNFFAN